RNPNLTDSSSREGLIQDEGFSDLKSLVVGCVRILELKYHDEFQAQKEQQLNKPSPSEEVKALNKELRSLKKDLRTILPVMADSSEEAVERALEKVELIVEQIEGTQRSILELASQTTVYRGLATIGIAASVFGHETQISIDGFFGAAQTAKMHLEHTPPNMDVALDELSKAMVSANRVAAWGQFALARTKRDKRRRKLVNIKDTIEGLIKEVKPSFESADISIISKLEPISGRTFAMDLEAILLNLLTNAYSACRLMQKRIIRVELSKKLEDKRLGFKLAVSDSGPGVAEQLRARIWEPLYSNKVDSDGNEIGTGLGLPIIRSILEDLKGTRSQDRDPHLGGARFSVWIPLE
ncbi:MAG TPA: ATP-binding protein, partial [Nitrososphaera sp.]